MQGSIVTEQVNADAVAEHQHPRAERRGDREQIERDGLEGDQDRAQRHPEDEQRRADHHRRQRDEPAGEGAAIVGVEPRNAAHQHACAGHAAHLGRAALAHPHHEVDERVRRGLLGGDDLEQRRAPVP